MANGGAVKGKGTGTNYAKELDRLAGERKAKTVVLQNQDKKKRLGEVQQRAAQRADNASTSAVEYMHRTISDVARQTKNAVGTDLKRGDHSSDAPPADGVLQKPVK